MKSLIVLLSLVSFAAFANPEAPAAAAASTSTDAEFDSLGGNQVILDRARALEPDQKISIVQNRTVSRRNRVELAPEFSGTFGGDTYSRTRSLGMNVNYHFNPRWSVGVKYSYSFNDLTPEGEAMVDAAAADYQKNPSKPSAQYAVLDYPKTEMLGLVNWYPFYGKMNLMDMAVAHFDFYFVGGAGQVELLSGPTSTYTGGAGVGFWINNNFSTRMEMRYQNYTAKYFDKTKDMDLAVASVQMGWML